MHLFVLNIDKCIAVNFIHMNVALFGNFFSVGMNRAGMHYNYKLAYM